MQFVLLFANNFRCLEVTLLFVAFRLYSCILESKNFRMMFENILNVFECFFLVPMFNDLIVLILKLCTYCVIKAVCVLCQIAARQWNHIEDLDDFFTRVYHYHQRNGFVCMVLQDVMQLMYAPVAMLFHHFFVMSCLCTSLLFKFTLVLYF